MAGITDASFLKKVIPYGFNVATLGGFNLDAKTIEASKNILKRGRDEFYFPEDVIFSHIENEVLEIKKFNPNVKVSLNVRSSSPQAIVRASEIEDVDIVEINCHCRQPEFLEIGCGQNMLFNPDLEEFIGEVVDNAASEVSVKIRANVEGVDTLQIAKTVESAGANYIHVDAMAPGVFDADYDLLKLICDNVDISVIGNNSINNEHQIENMLKTGVSGFSIARALISGKLNFNISNF